MEEPFDQIGGATLNTSKDFIYSESNTSDADFKLYIQRMLRIILTWYVENPDLKKFFLDQRKFGKLGSNLKKLGNFLYDIFNNEYSTQDEKTEIQEMIQSFYNEEKKRVVDKYKAGESTTITNNIQSFVNQIGNYTLLIKLVLLLINDTPRDPIQNKTLKFLHIGTLLDESTNNPISVIEEYIRKVKEAEEAKATAAAAAAATTARKTHRKTRRQIHSKKTLRTHKHH
jgi:hypothetical protein